MVRSWWEIFKSSWAEINPRILQIYGFLGLVDFVLARCLPSRFDDVVPRLYKVFYIMPWYGWVIMGLFLVLYGAGKHISNLQKSLDGIAPSKNSQKSKTKIFKEFLDRKIIQGDRKIIGKIMQFNAWAENTEFGIKAALGEKHSNEFRKRVREYQKVFWENLDGTKADGTSIIVDVHDYLEERALESCLSFVVRLRKETSSGMILSTFEAEDLAEYEEDKALNLEGEFS